ncbi:MAG: AAA family ATPase [Bacteroidales bacterium]|nr:AAA family ATPase [Bacteroidales bacterium]
MKKRKLFGSLISEKNNIKISIILGARQVGKTTILNELYQNLINDNNGIYLDLDILSNYEKVSTYENLINTLKLKGYKENQTEIFYLFLDEFQRYREFSKILKNVFDHHKNIKIYATGSSSVKIKDEIQESLAGRKIIHNLFPLDFEEFIIFKDNHDALQQLKNVDKLKATNFIFRYYNHCWKSLWFLEDILK